MSAWARRPLGASPTLPYGDRVLHAEIPLPSTLGPMDDEGRIAVGGLRVFLTGGRKVLERAEAALHL